MEKVKSFLDAVERNEKGVFRKRRGVFTKLLHLSDLLGLGRTFVWQTIVKE